MDVALRILRRECGKPDDWMPAGILLEEDGLRSSREKWKHKSYELESQIEELEAQRLRWVAVVVNRAGRRVTYQRPRTQHQAQSTQGAKHLP